MQLNASRAVDLFVFFNDTATTEIYTLSLHDALPISSFTRYRLPLFAVCDWRFGWLDRKSTRLNSSHLVISYAVFFLKKKITEDDPAPSLVVPVDSASVDHLGWAL